MWPYYGSKGGIINFYPPPKYGKIIEPFAGTARYALKYFDRDILIVDEYDVMIKIWKWLQLCSPQDILKLPRLKEAERVSDYKLDCEEAVLLMGFLVGKNVQSPKNKASARATTQRPKHINYQIKKIAGNLYKIKHWNIVLGSYQGIDNFEATYFIDPPYQVGGYVYKKHKIDYKELAEWCRSRNGQVIACENTKANWLPFLPMKKQRGSTANSTEAIWSNLPTQYEVQQKVLF